ncbi:TIGR01777 family oxidoreductase [Arthrobacter zhaoguopingii]|uniref:TIGR01777 family oxidoreductase n=1 Tax=Arthrobacter zhaoguopingii TaxID=2681491 RepID=UPI001359BFF4|nr:TIGR01777 family oxidoreductase [Arthrobacter zhaoguopingii]
MHILIAGASGLIGKALSNRLRDNHTVTRLVRRAPAGPDEVAWDPARGELDPSVMDQADAVINLSGTSIAGGLWTRSHKESLYSSRIRSTRTLVEAMRRAGSPPAVFLSQSASGYYGNRGDEVLTEASGSGDLFLSDVCRRWEAEAVRAPEGVRTVLTRTGIVMSRKGGALPKLLLPMRLYAGGPLGSGQQWWPWITMTDEVRAMEHLLTAEVEGPVNLCAPQPERLQTLLQELGRALHRPTRFRVPQKVLTVAMGQLADELLLVSARMDPKVLTSSGFRFDAVTAADLAEQVRDRRV